MLDWFCNKAHTTNDEARFAISRRILNSMLAMYKHTRLGIKWGDISRIHNFLQGR